MDEAERAARRERMRAAMGPDNRSEYAKELTTSDKPSSTGSLKKGCLWLFGIAFALVLIGAISGDPASEEVGESAEVEQSENTEPVNEVVMRDWYFSILNAAKPCDRASSSMGDALKNFASGRGATLTVYQSAIRADEACRETSLSYGRLNVPDGLPDAVEEAVDQAHETCQNGFVLKQMAAAKAAEVFDGAMSNSNITRLQELSNDGQNGVFACVAAAMTAVGEAGIESETIASWSE